MKSWIFSLGLMLFAPLACASSLDQLFQPDTLGSQISYWEHQLGPAWKIIENTKIFKVDGCTVSVGVKKGVIQSMSMDLTQNCNPDISGFISSGKHNRAYNTSFSDWGGEGGQYYADCLSMCGNAMISYVDLFFSGYHANDFIDVTLSSSMEEEPTLTQSLLWERIMEAKEGQDYIIDTKFNCDQRYNNLAKQLFQSSKINRITVGVNTPSQFCKSQF